MSAFREERANITKDGFAYNAVFLRSYVSAALLRLCMGKKRHSPTLRIPVKPHFLRVRASVCPNVRYVESMNKCLLFFKTFY